MTAYCSNNLNYNNINNINTVTTSEHFHKTLVHRQTDIVKCRAAIAAKNSFQYKLIIATESCLKKVFCWIGYWSALKKKFAELG